MPTQLIKERAKKETATILSQLQRTQKVWPQQCLGSLEQGLTTFVDSAQPAGHDHRKVENHPGHGEKQVLSNLTTLGWSRSQDKSSKFVCSARAGLRPRDVQGQQFGAGMAPGPCVVQETQWNNLEIKVRALGCSFILEVSLAHTSIQRFRETFGPSQMEAQWKTLECYLKICTVAEKGTQWNDFCCDCILLIGFVQSPVTVGNWLLQFLNLLLQKVG